MFALRAFDDVVSMVSAGEVTALHLEKKSQGQCAGTLRVLCLILVGNRAYDAFLNAPVGLRAQYASCPVVGEKANQVMVQRLRPLALSCESLGRLSSTERDLARKSIESTEARVWVNDRDWPASGAPGLRFERWVRKAAAANSGTAAEQQARGFALNGVLAPVGTTIEFKGGWHRPTGQPCIDGGKTGRAWHIHEYGCA